MTDQYLTARCKVWKYCLWQNALICCLHFFVLCRTKQAPTKTSIPTWSKSWSPLSQNSASQHQRNWALTGCKRSRWDCPTPWIMNYIMLLASAENIFFPRPSGTLIHQEMSSPGSLLSNMSILLIKSMMSCCVQNGGPNKETSNLVMCVFFCFFWYIHEYFSVFVVFYSRCFDSS